MLGLVGLRGETSWLCTIEGRRRCELLVIQLSHTNDAHHRFEKRRPPLLLQLVSLCLTPSG